MTTVRPSRRIAPEGHFDDDHVRHRRRRLGRRRERRDHRRGRADHEPSVTARRASRRSKGAKALYRRLVNAAAEVCPQYGGNPHFVTGAVRHCREQAIANAVFKINNPRLAAVHATNAKNG